MEREQFSADFFFRILQYFFLDFFFSIFVVVFPIRRWFANEFCRNNSFSNPLRIKKMMENRKTLSASLWITSRPFANFWKTHIQTLKKYEIWADKNLVRLDTVDADRNFLTVKKKVIRKPCSFYCFSIFVDCQRFVSFLQFWLRKRSLAQCEKWGPLYIPAHRTLKPWHICAVK